MGLVFFHLLTGGGNPMAITSTTVKNKTHYQVKVDFKLLDSFRTDTDTILFIDLIKRMVQEKPVHRETRSLVYCHGAFKTNTERLEVVQGLSKKCFNGNQGDKYLISIIDMHKLHMVGSLGESSTEWLEFLAEAAKHQLKPDIKVCSSLLEIFKKVIIN